MKTCSYFAKGICKTCGYLDRSYELSLEEKWRSVHSHFPNFNISPIVPSPKPLGSRAKTKWALAQNNEGYVFGFPETSGEIKADISHCPQHQEIINSITKAMAPLFNKHKILAYDVSTKKGELKFLTMTTAQAGKEIMLRFTLRSKESHERMQKLSAEIRILFPEIKVISATIQAKHTALRDGEFEIFYTEKKYLEDESNGLKIYYGPQSFIQVNPEIKAMLYKHTANFFVRHKCSEIMDLYCGSGAFALHLAKDSPDSLIKGFELSEEAIKLAQIAKVANQLENIQFEVMDLEDQLPPVQNTCEGLVVNPPRRGLGLKLIQSILQSKIQYLAYSSCNIGTLERDYKLLQEEFKLLEITPYDMFPYTDHLECLAFFERI